MQKKVQVSPVFNQPESLFTPAVFPTLASTIKANPARNLMRLSRQDGPLGKRGLGDFNIVLSHVERLGASSSDVEMQHFQECVSLCNMEDVQATGALFTWSNKQEPADRIYSRLDRVMGNQKWMCQYADYVAHFHPEGIFYHCPCTVVNRRVEFGGRRSFKYFNMWGMSEHFIECVESSWKQRYEGTKMFRVVKKLKNLKPVLKRLNKECFSDIENNTNLTSILLEQLQKELVDKPGDMELMHREMDVTHELRELMVARDSFLVQKAKIQWSLEGDINTAYFHNSIKKRVMLNKVLAIEDKNGHLYTEGDQIQAAFLCGKSCTQEHCDILNAPVTAEEEVCAAVIIFFEIGKLLQQLNATIITLIPKVDRPSSVTHFRPISCCNVLYKTISKLMCNRMAKVLPEVISRNQGPFIEGRSILENILICQDLVRLYNRENMSPGCMFKLDLPKAYDTIEWKFLDQMLDALCFPKTFRMLLMSCVMSTSFSLNLNGSQFGYFKGKRGLRQGDPVSPLLFTICMEYLTRVLYFATQKWFFRFHPLCGALKLNHLLFADDLLMFCKGDVISIMLLLRAFATFSATSGLRVNAAKSEVVFNWVPEELRADIIQVSGFREGALPMKYLGIPIQADRLTTHDCNVLVDKIVGNIRGIGARKLSYAGRLTLINSVFNTLYNYWASIFLIPKLVIKKIKAVCRNYLWDGGVEYSRTPLVSWKKICCNKKSGGLGVIEAGVWNIAVVGKLVNWIYTKANRLWVQWVDHVYMKGTDWCHYQPPLDSNWNWRNICKVRDIMQAGYQNNFWVADPRGYSIRSGYHWLQGQHPPVQWYREVWDTWCVPKHSIIGWLIHHEALNTREKLFAIEVSESRRCVICESKRVMNGIENWLQVKLDGANPAYSAMQIKVCHMAKMACWYYVWMERNHCRLEGRLARPELLCADVKRLVRSRIQQLLPSVLLYADKRWLLQLGICVS
ncbi:uncharacterized protein LOC141601872 [Silene latifolia]|uniref:uncharacterized protein LOC141601872 n=1 Tax=Silene latifolia TaxID=37657 RepID=UPI003D7722D5